MAELNASIAINLAGNLERRARQYGEGLERLGRRGQRAFRGMSAQVGRIGRRMARMGTSVTGLLAGGGMIAAATMIGRRAMATEERLTRLGIAADLSQGRMEGLWDRINAVATMEGIKADPSEVLGAVEEIVERTGDLQFAEGQLENLARAIQATGAEGASIGAIAAEMQKMDIRTPAAVAAAFDTLNEQGKQGAFTLEHIARLGPRIFAAYGTSGRGGLAAVREMGAALQMIRRGTGNAEQATTAFEALMRTLQDPTKIAFLRQQGVQIFDPEALKRDEQMLRPINELMEEIIRAAGGRATLLGEVFDAEAMRAFNSAVAQFNRRGRLELEEFMRVEPAGQTAADAARAAATSAQQFSSAVGKLDKVTQDLMDGPVTTFADAVDKLVNWDVRDAFGGAVVPQGGEGGESGGASIQPQLGGPGQTIGEALGRGTRRVLGLDPGYTVPDEVRAEIDRRLGAEGRVTVEVRAEPGTEARVTGVEGRGIGVDTGQALPESAR